ncbi:MAG TPA: hypothetical protein VLF89_01480 [Candidatus Saccharimonadales bacterium]|nr:hypothetical protein [Candidatus Saccharimonadales bacterium]
MRTLLIIFIALFIIAIAVAGIIFFVSPKNITITATEKNAAFTKLLGREPILTEKVRSNAFVQYSDQYLRFMYPAAAKKYPSEEIDNTTVLENFQFQETDGPRYHFVTQVDRVETQDVASLRYDDVSGVRLRRLQNNIYTESSLSSPVGTWVVFVKKNDMFEKTGFLVVNGKLYTFSITGSDPIVEKIFDGVVESATLPPHLSPLPQGEEINQFPSNKN